MRASLKALVVAGSSFLSTACSEKEFNLDTCETSTSVVADLSSELECAVEAIHEQYLNEGLFSTPGLVDSSVSDGLYQCFDYYSVFDDLACEADMDLSLVRMIAEGINADLNSSRGSFHGFYAHDGKDSICVATYLTESDNINYLYSLDKSDVQSHLSTCGLLDLAPQTEECELDYSVSDPVIECQLRAHEAYFEKTAWVDAYDDRYKDRLYGVISGVEAGCIDFPSAIEVMACNGLVDSSPRQLLNDTLKRGLPSGSSIQSQALSQNVQSMSNCRIAIAFEFEGRHAGDLVSIPNADNYAQIIFEECSRHADPNLAFETALSYVETD